MPKENTNENTYKVVTVEKSAAPRGMMGDDWYHYVIGRGSSIIEGNKVGTLKEVTVHAKDLAERINARSDKYGVTYVSTYSPRKKKLADN
ncbi:hypothetical protein ACFL3P_04725 [Pseudomonadota bacterium]